MRYFGQLVLGSRNYVLKSWGVLAPYDRVAVPNGAVRIDLFRTALNKW
jgi:hypothetical protein